MSARAWIETHDAELGAGLRSLRGQAGTVERWGATLARRLTEGARLLAAGNGGSAAEAQHLTSELVGRFLHERRPLSALCLCSESSSVTAIVNDYGIDEMFARQVEAHGRPGDVLVLLSTSGRSANVLRAAERAREVGVEVWSMTGPGPNPLAAASDDVLVVDAPTTAAVQAVHLVAVHAVCAVLDEHLALRPAGSPGSARAAGRPAAAAAVEVRA
ncbi:D-sedoheptulose-7-phosphate isomerase [Cellulomonas dongxiuzhuiae]|uniref:SIS domain-containing protein n=1 Tax=Cellulomonas dongxiuzhuiae TaxID=2819979 RepID=A0ABX8GPY2_9CELL|nr:SIS domain-containing protein [Cellulomonas dongxiuzhuiae]QWC17616.1 SIS domain-containing protein [Cellulomonas dongxiuzhuiae]